MPAHAFRHVGQVSSHDSGVSPRCERRSKNAVHNCAAPEMWTEFRRRVLTGELSKRAACREYGINWRTLVKMLAHVEPPPSSAAHAPHRSFGPPPRRAHPTRTSPAKKYTQVRVTCSAACSRVRPLGITSRATSLSFLGGGKSNPGRLGGRGRRGRSRYTAAKSMPEM